MDVVIVICAAVGRIAHPSESTSSTLSTSSSMSMIGWRPEVERGAWLEDGADVLDVGINNVDDATKKRGGRTPPRQECRRVRQPIGVIATCLTEDQLRQCFVVDGLHAADGGPRGCDEGPCEEDGDQSASFILFVVIKFWCIYTLQVGKLLALQN